MQTKLIRFELMKELPFRAEANTFDWFSGEQIDSFNAAFSFAAVSILSSSAFGNSTLLDANLGKIGVCP